jgi:hypothetical protein
MVRDEPLIENERNITARLRFSAQRKRRYLSSSVTQDTERRAKTEVASHNGGAKAPISATLNEERFPWLM